MDNIASFTDSCCRGESFADTIVGNTMDTKVSLVLGPLTDVKPRGEKCLRCVEGSCRGTGQGVLGVGLSFSRTLPLQDTIGRRGDEGVERLTRRRVDSCYKSCTYGTFIGSGVTVQGCKEIVNKKYRCAPKGKAQCVGYCGCLKGLC